MSSNSTEGPKVRLIVPPTFEGVTSAAVLEEIVHEGVQLDVVYLSHLDFREYKVLTEVEITVVLGFAYQGYVLPDDFYTQLDVPFGDLIHFSTYGVPLVSDHIISEVFLETDPVYELLKFIERVPDYSMLSKHVTITDKSRQLAEAANMYRTWTWESHSVTRMLVALYNAGYKRMPLLLKGKSLTEAVKANAAVVKGQLEKMGDYIEKKRGMVKTFPMDINGNPVILKVVFAEEYINELASDILNREQSATPLIVCVGRSTKSEDLLSIRTRNVNAATVAHLINKGSGKENVASVFSGVKYSELIGRSIVAQLSNGGQ